ncbi:uncharacterized protein LOC143563687 [Bidens hawaiensis]|uniref:uncharacterized protein LOC143563687 n=1 Tax=Bidens hawaiensis TaxID=980011 RepID=UPI0040497662
MGISCGTRGLMRHNDRIMMLRLVLREVVVAVVCAYAPHAELGDQEKREFWECLDAIVRDILRDERICIGGDFNGHIGKNNDGFQSVQGGFSFGDMNDTGVDLLDFAVAHELGIINSFFKKRESHLITFSSGGRNTQIDYLLMRQGDRRFRNKLTERARKFRPRIRWGALKDDNLSLFKDKLVSSTLVQLDGDSNQIWEALATKITQVANETLGVTTGKASGHKESWWWNKIVQDKIRDKQGSLRELVRCTDEREHAGLREMYKGAKKEAKKAVSEAKNTAYKRMYERLETKEGEHDMFKIAKARERT